MEQRANIKFCFKLGKTAAETVELMRQVCRTGQAVMMYHIFGWQCVCGEGRVVCVYRHMYLRMYSYFHLICFYLY